MFSFRLFKGVVRVVQGKIIKKCSEEKQVRVQTRGSSCPGLELPRVKLQ